MQKKVNLTILGAPPVRDLSEYQSVAAWCCRFGVDFATAPLLRH